MYVHDIIIRAASSSSSFWGLDVKDPTKVNATRVGIKDRSMLLPTIRTIPVKPMMVMINHKKTLPKPVSDLDLGRMVNDGLVFRQNIYIRSYEVGPDQTTSIETIMNHLQETALNHLKTIGILQDGFGSTPEMCKKNLIWVMTKMQLVVDRSPAWGDVVQVDTWKAASGKNGMRCNWMFRDSKTGAVLIRASSIWVMMNKETRRLFKFPCEVRAELEQYFLDTPPVVKQDTIKWSKQDENIVDHVRNGLTPRWSDLDINQHVNNVKYIGWILESVPVTIMENYELTSMTLEYCRECRKDNVVQSRTFVIGTDNGEIANRDHVGCEHLLQLEVGGGSGDRIMKGRSRWRSKYAEK
ncbi:putative oleoyl-[acyl-carrier-protein] hydrolase [Helianthus debilis subsp. tardiflorus]